MAEGDVRPNVAFASEQPSQGLPQPDVGQLQFPQQPVDLGTGNNNQAPPKPGGMPALAGFLTQMFGGQNQRGYAPAPQGQPGRPVSRLDAFENFVGNFLNSFA